MSNPNLPIIGEHVIINSCGHLMDGRTGVVVYHSQFMGTIGVSVDGHNYGFMPSEVSAKAAE